jgi:chorismate mutase
VVLSVARSAALDGAGNNNRPRSPNRRLVVRGRLTQLGEVLSFLLGLDKGSGGGNTQFAMSDDQLTEYRRSIDNIDAAVVHMLAERFKITKKVGAYKAQTGLPPADPDREARQIGRLRTLAAEAELDPAFSEKFLRFLIDEVIRHHEAQRTTSE